MRQSGVRRLLTLVSIMVVAGYAVRAGSLAIRHDWRGWAAPIPYALGVGAYAVFYDCLRVGTTVGGGQVGVPSKCV